MKTGIKKAGRMATSAVITSSAFTGKYLCLGLAAPLTLISATAELGRKPLKAGQQSCTEVLDLTEVERSEVRIIRAKARLERANERLEGAKHRALEVEAAREQRAAAREQRAAAKEAVAANAATVGDLVNA